METKIVKIGNKVIGGGNPILIQSMTNTKIENVAYTVAQINALTDLGCDIIRYADLFLNLLKCLCSLHRRHSTPDYITEAGTIISGNIKSAIGLGLILSQGIGDTIRVSLTGSPLEEIKSAKLILRTQGLRKGGIEVVS